MLAVDPESAFSEASYRDMATLTMQCLADMRNDTTATKQQLLDIMMAQDSRISPAR